MASTTIQVPAVEHSYSFLFARISQLCRTRDLVVPRMTRSTDGKMCISVMRGNILQISVPLPDPSVSADWFARKVFAHYLLALAGNGHSARVAEILADAMGT